MSKVDVVGAGAWGSALAIQAHRAGHCVTLWARTAFAGREPPRLPGQALPEGVRVAVGLPPGPAEAVILAVPVQALRGVLTGWRPRGLVLVCAKGVAAGSGALPLEVLADVQPGVAGAVLSGPNFAHEIAAGLPAASVVAARDAGLRAELMGLLGTSAFRLYGNDDPLGVQLGGAAKNVIAIAAGAVMGAGLGENARAALVTRGLAELGRLVVAQGGRMETVAGLSGLGDLLLTCTGPSSCNFAFGVALGQGVTPEAALARSRGVVEGAVSAAALLRRAGDVELPVCQAVAGLVGERTTLTEAIGALLARPPRHE